MKILTDEEIASIKEHYEKLTCGDILPIYPDAQGDIPALIYSLFEAREALKAFTCDADKHKRRGNGNICNRCGCGYPCAVIMAKEALGEEQ